MTYTQSERDAFAIGFAEWITTYYFKRSDGYLLLSGAGLYGAKPKTTQQLLAEYINTLKDESKSNKEEEKA
jgi:hypothetical protein